jgi:hypothetical protein
MPHVRRVAPLILALAVSLPSHADESDPLAAARQASMMLIKTLGGELTAAMSSGGAEKAVSVCKDRAPVITADISKKTGMDVRRVSIRNRNPNAVPDTWEAEAISALEKRLAAGEKPETLDMSAVVADANGKTFRYAKAIVTQPRCLSCHGTSEDIPEGVKAKLSSGYPADKAVGYAPGMLRGIITIKKAL